MSDNTGIDKPASGSYLSLLRNPSFVFLWLSNTVSRMGDILLRLALVWFVLEKTGSALKVGILMVFQILPLVILGLLAGVIVDHVDRKKIMIASDIFRGTALLALPVLSATGMLQIWHVYIVAALLSCASAFFFPAAMAAIPGVVEDSELFSANAFFGMSSQAVEVIGAGLGGFFLAWAGSMWGIYLDSASFFISAGFLFFISLKRQKLEKGKFEFSRAGKEIKDGLVFIRRDLYIMFVVSSVLLVNFILGPVEVLDAVFSERVLNAGVAGFGLLGGANAAGVLFGSLIAGKLPLGFGKRESLKLIVSALAAVGVFLVMFSFTKHLYPAMAFYVLIGTSIGLCNVPVLSLIQRLVPDDMRGRVFATLNTFILGAQPLAMAIGTALADRIGVVPVYRIAGLLTVVAMAACIPLIPKLLPPKKEDVTIGF
ncbi:MAG: MFS transporter [Chloroflexi bacterium]|nr:MFS transporter [Chloroflexota bacterium]